MAASIYGKSGDTLLDILNQIAEAEPVSPARLRPGVPLDLEAVCLKCLEKDPTRRYASAAELADDLRRILSRGPKKAGGAKHWRRLADWCRDHPFLAGLYGLTILYAIAVTGAALWLWRAVGHTTN